MRSVLIIVLGILLSCASAEALILGGTNLGIFGYPSHDCGMKPPKPFRPFSFSSQWEIDSYNMEVDSYNLAMNRFVSCLREYIDNSKNDIKRIEEKIDEAGDSRRF